LIYEGLLQFCTERERNIASSPEERLMKVVCVFMKDSTVLYSQSKTRELMMEKTQQFGVPVELFYNT